MVAQRIETPKERVEALKSAPLPPMVMLGKVDTLAATGWEEQVANANINLRLGLPFIDKLPEFGKKKGHDRPIALVGGGPSLKDHLDELRKFNTIISCGSVHDYLISNGFKPRYATNCDPDPVCANYFTKKDPETIYMFASTSSPKLIEALNGYPVVLWHCHSEDHYPHIQKIQEELKLDSYYGVGGGCTVGLRSISIAMALGYTNIHFFGFDSCMADEGNGHHAYEFSTEEENNLIEKIYRIRLGDTSGPLGKLYYVAGYQLAQAENFKAFYCKYSEYFQPTFHGEGLLKETYELLLRVDEEIMQGRLKIKEQVQ